MDSVICDANFSEKLARAIKQIRNEEIIAVKKENILRALIVLFMIESLLVVELWPLGECFR